MSFLDKSPPIICVYYLTDINWEISRAKIRLIRQLGIGEFGAVYDAEVRLGKNMKSRALVKVC